MRGKKAWLSVRAEELYHGWVPRDQKKEGMVFIWDERDGKESGYAYPSGIALRAAERHPMGSHISSIEIKPMGEHINVYVNKAVTVSYQVAVFASQYKEENDG